VFRTPHGSELHYAVCEKEATAIIEVIKKVVAFTSDANIYSYD